MKAGGEEFETARARSPRWVGNDPVLEIGRARFLVVTARVKRCRSRKGPSTDSRWSNGQRGVGSLRRENVLKNSAKPERKRKKTLLR